MKRDRLTLAELVRFWRRRARLSQRALAEKAGISRQAIADLESGTITNPQLDTLRAIARACGCDVRELIPDDKGPPRSSRPHIPRPRRVWPLRSVRVAV